MKAIQTHSDINYLKKITSAFFLSVLLIIGLQNGLIAQDIEDPIVIGEAVNPADELPGFRVGLDIETGGFWFSQNEVRIPGDEGTKFDMLDLIGTGADAYIRLNLNMGFGERHNVRLLFAPLTKTGTGILEEPVFFEQSEFAAGLPTEGSYRFNTYRATYRYDFFRDDRWEIGAGAAVLIRDAEVELVQGDLRDSNSDLGFVPLLHFRTSANLTDRFSAVLDAEGLFAQQGRAIDATLHGNFRLNENWSLFAGYRFLDGGADTDDVYNFAWINYLMGGISFQLR
ncbi:MAG: hypothetical protein LAT84_06935 [Balneolia bacterium]|nr:hypothetical protein [Balneolia bacterium]